MAEQQGISWQRCLCREGIQSLILEPLELAGKLWMQLTSEGGLVLVQAWGLIEAL